MSSADLSQRHHDQPATIAPGEAARERVKPGAGQKREAILRAALEVFAEHGVHGVAVPEIAARAGVGTGTIYRYFENKEALVNEVFRAGKAALARRLDVPMDREIAARAVFNQIWQRLTEFAQEEWPAFRFLELQDHFPYLDVQSRMLERKTLAPMLEAVRALQRAGVFRADLRAEVMLAMYWGAFVNLHKAQRAGHFSLTPEDLQAACDACWRLCRTPPSPDAAA